MMNLELIIWEDTTSHHGGAWSDSPESEGITIFHTVGWVTEETPRYITVWSTVSFPKGTYGHDNCIPKGCILKRKKLNVET